MVKIKIKENVKYWDELDKFNCINLDNKFYESLTESEKFSYKSEFVPNKNGTYDLVASYA